MDELITRSNISPADYKTLYPLFVFDVSKQSEKLVFKKYANYKWNSFVNWLTQHLPPKPKVIDEAFDC